MSAETLQILLVEDDENHVELIRRTFAAEGEKFNLTLAGTLADTRKILKKTSPDLMIADYLLPDGKGIELLPGDSNTLAFPVVILTSHGNEKIATAAMKAGALDYIVKSSETFADMPHIINRILREWKHITQHRQAEEKASGLNKILEESLNEIYIFDAETLKFIQANYGARVNLGYELDELSNLTPLDLKPEFTKTSFEKLINPLRSGKKEKLRFTTVHRRKDGTLYPVEVNLQLSTFESREVFVAIVLDITEHKQAEMALEHSNRALKTLSACNRVLIHAEDEAQFLNDICHAIVEQGGYKLAWIGHAEHDRAKSIRPIAQAEFDEGYLESLNITWDDKKRGRGPAGTAIRNREPSIAQNIQDDPRFSPWREAALKHGYRSCAALPIMVDDEVFGALVVYASESYAFNEDEVNLLTELAGDIAFGISRLRLRTRRLQAEEALQKSEWQYHEIIKTTRDAFVSIDADGIITDWNPQAEKMFGWSRDEALGRLVAETLIPEEFCEAHTQGLKHYLATGKGPVLNQSIEINAQHRDGHTFPVELSIVPLQTNGTKRFNAFIRDISARQKAKKALKASLVGTIVAISKAVGARDPYTAGHQQRVARLARCIAQEMNLDSDRIDGLRMGATIHDIGKIQLPAEILSKPTKLTETEFKLIKTHAQVGYDILKDIEFPWPIADIAHQHHERLDGTGYPQGLKGEEICLEARIVAVADVVEAISSHRPYRASLGIDAALEEIETHRGKWYEPAVVDACLKLIREKKFSFDDNRPR